MSDMHRDTFVFKLMTDFKSDGYAVYCIMLEILADNDGIDQAILIEKEFLTQNLRMKFKKANQILQRWKELKPEITYIDKGKEILFYTPKIKEIMDNWSRREKPKTTELLCSNAVVTTEETYTNTKTETKTKTKDLNTLSAENTADLIEIEKYFVSGVLDKYKTAYAIDYGKDRKIFKTLLKIFSKDRLKKAVDKFLDSPNFADCHTIGVFKTQINKIMQTISATPKTFEEQCRERDSKK